MSDIITLVRLEADSGGDRTYEGVCRAIDYEADRLGMDDSHHWFMNLPGPGGDQAARDYFRTKKTGCWVDKDCLYIEAHERCACIDMNQLHQWWPTWSLHALVHADAEHDVHLRIVHATLEQVRIGRYQSVYDSAADEDSLMIPLAGIGDAKLAELLRPLPVRFDNFEPFDQMYARREARPAYRGDDDAIQF